MVFGNVSSRMCEGYGTGCPDIYWPREALKVEITERTILFSALRAGFNAYVINLKKTLFICYVDVILRLKSLVCEYFLICNR